MLVAAGFHFLSIFAERNPLTKTTSIRTTFSLRNKQQTSRRSLMTAKNNAFSYREAVACLNGLQSNAEILSKIRNKEEIMSDKLQETKQCLEVLGITLDDIDRLRCIHVTGTKGKGSTCAFVESILRRLGYQTGFFSSPHLIEVRERIRLNGEPISKGKFAHYFFQVYNALQKKVVPMPSYFKFLTVMSFWVFINERVEVAIVEVGIGGEYDSTNIIQRPIVTAITTLDLDHTSILGETLPEIAWHKAGVAKQDSVLLTVPQTCAAMDVIERRCHEKQCAMYVVPCDDKLSAYKWPSSNPHFGISGRHQILNISVALQLVRFWLTRTRSDTSAFCEKLPPLTNTKELAGFFVSEKLAAALETCHWPGRCQIVPMANVVYYIDGAHSPQSMKLCADWFLESTATTTTTDLPIRVLVFHCTGNRDSSVLLQKLVSCHFNLALFCPAQSLSKDQEKMLASDNLNLKLDAKVDMARCESDKEIWTQLANNVPSLALPNVNDALQKIIDLAHENSTSANVISVQVLVTGSLHLVGTVLGLLQPSESADE